jgi:hypothetical protein
MTYRNTAPQPIAARKPLRLGCTLEQHARMGIDAVVNARGGEIWRNDLDVIEENEMARDAWKVRDKLERNVTIYQFNSRHFRRRPELQSLLTSRSDW